MKSRTAYLYLIICKFEEYKFIKIGQTIDLYRRIQNIKTGCPHIITNIIIMQSEYRLVINGFEKLLNRMLSEKRQNGEWFICDAQFLISFRKLLSMIGEGKLLDDNYEFLDDVSFDEMEILLHSHELKFSSVSLPIKSDKKFDYIDLSIDEIIEILQ